MDSKQKSLRKNGWAITILLIIQYILGMATMAFVKFPDSGTPGQYWQFANSQLLLVFHMAVGASLVIGAVILLVRAIIHNNKTWKIASAIGLAAILVAGFAGERFVSLQMDAWSFVMGLGFIGALIAYGWGLYVSKEIG